MFVVTPNIINTDSFQTTIIFGTWHMSEVKCYMKYIFRIKGFLVLGGRYQSPMKCGNVLESPPLLLSKMFVCWQPDINVDLFFSSANQVMK